MSYHEREEDGGLFHGLDYPESHETANLDHRIEMDPAQLNLTQIRIVRLKLLGHEEEKDPIKELQAIQGGYSHEEEYTLTKK